MSLKSEVRSLNMATKGKQLLFNLRERERERERERSYFSCGRRGRCWSFLRGNPALDEVARELVTVHPDLFGGLSKKSAGCLLIEQHRKRENWSRKQSGTNEQSNTSNTGLFIQLIKANWNGGRETSCSASPSVFHSACEKKTKFWFIQISVFVRGQKMSSELTIARPEPPNRQTNPPNRPTKCKTLQCIQAKISKTLDKRSTLIFCSKLHRTKTELIRKLLPYPEFVK